MGGEPGSEAHGGYTFCGLAALHLAGRTDVLSLPRLLHWAVHRQVGACLPCSRPRLPLASGRRLGASDASSWAQR